MRKKLHGSGWRVDLETSIGTQMPIAMFGKEEDARLFSQGMAKKNKIRIIREEW
jgi:hypothetical protein